MAWCPYLREKNWGEKESRDDATQDGTEPGNLITRRESLLLKTLGELAAGTAAQAFGYVTSPANGADCRALAACIHDP